MCLFWMIIYYNILCGDDNRIKYNDFLQQAFIKIVRSVIDDIKFGTTILYEQ